jgi:NhaA family Na+:H+ antiporter
MSAPLRSPSRAQILTNRALSTLERFLHVEAVSGVILLLAAAAALAWANSPWADSYDAVWQTPITFGIGTLVTTQTLHFWINDGLMTIFFLVVGMEIRREIHEGALSNLRQAALPIGAAVGGVAIPALIYLAFNTDGTRQHGWAVPTATDIAFAVGVLALLSRGIPGNVRIFLLALAIIDDVIAVLIIALFYSGGLEFGGLAVSLAGIVMVVAMQRMGIGSAWSYVVPGAVVWAGLLVTGAHPTLAGVVLGLLTPVFSTPSRHHPVEQLSRATDELKLRADRQDAGLLAGPLREVRQAQREVLPPVVRVQSALHPWVAYGVMPIFALANAGVAVGSIDLDANGASWVLIGIAMALVLGKPLGIVTTSWVLVKLGWCRLPDGVSWSGIVLVGLLAGVGFTMSIFIAMLAFDDPALLGAAKLGVLIGSVVAATLGLAWGYAQARTSRQTAPAQRA